MARQLERFVIIPITKEVLNNSSVKIPITFKEWYRFNKKKFRKLLFRHTKYFWKYIHSKRYNKYIIESGSVWRSIRIAKGLGYKVLLYPEEVSDLNKTEFQKLLQIILNKKLAVGILDNNRLNDFKKAIVKYDINPHNSVFLSSDYDLIEHLLKTYTPRNHLSEDNLFSKLPSGFKIVYLNKISNKRKTNQQIRSYNSISTVIYRELTNYIFSSNYYASLSDKIIYIENTFNAHVNQFIQSNLNWLQEQAKLKGCEFVYLPVLLTNSYSDINYLNEFIRYFYPNATKTFTHKYLSVLNSLTVSEITELFLELLNLPSFKTPALIRNRDTIISFSYSTLGEYSCFFLDDTKNLKEQFEFYFQKSLQKAFDDSGIRYRKIDIPEDGTADESFYSESNKVAFDVLKKIEYLKKHGMNSVLAEIAVQLFEGSEKEILQEIKSVKRTKKISQAPLAISRLEIEWTTKYYFEIILPDYGNMIVELPRLPKALYYFFLRHPDGVVLNQLPEHREELHSIYSRISNLSDKKVINANIDRLIDPYDNSINVNCSRIKNAFLKLIDDRLARNYYITGYRNEPKKISLPPDLINIKEIY
ncbi:MAG: hypothetical protein ACQESQ_12360 [Bacteroidota bacterium]